MSSNTEIIQAIQGLRAMLESLEARVSSVTAAPKVSTAPATEQTKTEPKQKREASEAVKAWNGYVAKVKEDMISSGWKHPETGKPANHTDAMKEASKRRPTDPDAPKPAEAKPKPKAKPSHPATADGEAKPKQRKPMTEEAKASAAAKRKATLERKKAEAEAAKASVIEPTHPVTTEPTTTSYPPLPPSPPEEEEGETLTPINIKAKKYVLNPHTNGCWKRNTDGSKGEWAGVYKKVDGKDTIDASVGERAFD
jgi:hypothetical protein